VIKVFVKIKNVYGREMVYPACPVTEIIASIAKTKTLSQDDLSNMLKLGYEIQVNSQPLIVSWR
jgi:hypothetical protein